MSKKITLARIKKLNPCDGRLTAALERCPEVNFTIKEFLKSDKITHDDKLWVAFRLMPKTKIRFVAGEIAKSVLHIYEERYPDNNSPRLAIKEALRKKLNKNADAATYAAAAYAAYAADAAYAATYAAYAADAAAYAAYAAAYAAAAYAAYAAAYAAAATNRNIQEVIQLKIITKYWKTVSK